MSEATRKMFKSLEDGDTDTINEAVQRGLKAKKQSFRRRKKVLAKPKRLPYKANN